MEISSLTLKWMRAMYIGHLKLIFSVLEGILISLLFIHSLDMPLHNGYVVVYSYEVQTHADL